MSVIGNVKRAGWAIATTTMLLVEAVGPVGVARAVSVSPRGVNVAMFEPTTVFLTFLGLTEDQVPAGGLWCGAIRANQSCLPGTVFGRLPQRSNLSRRSGQSNTNLTDIMTIPASVARRAYQDALRGNASEFFYVRRFVSTNGGPDEFVAVTCRLAGGGARVPLALTEVRLEFADSRIEMRGNVTRERQSTQQSTQPQAITVVPSADALPEIQAQIRYNGTGRLKGRWEVVLPGDVPPTRLDLLTEASLPIEERGLQRRYRLVERFDRFLPPTGRVTLPGPDPAKLPRGIGGLHRLLLRIEATADREGNSFTGVGTINSGGVAGFPMPVFRYFVGSQAAPNVSTIALVFPAGQGEMPADLSLPFQWQPGPEVAFYRLEITDVQGTALLSAILNANETQYHAPPLLQDVEAEALTSLFLWRVQGLDTAGQVIVQSEPQVFRLAD